MRGHPRSLHSHQVASHSVHDGLEDSNTTKDAHGVVEDDSAAGADKHGNQYGLPPGVEDGASVGVAIGDVCEERGEKDVGEDDGGGKPLVRGQVGPDEGGGPREKNEGGEVTEGGGDGGGNVVWVEVAPS